MSKMFLTNYLSLLTIVVKMYTVCSIELTYFRRTPERDGRSCLISDLLLDKTEDRLVLGDCLARCAWNPGCTSVFYDENSRKCFGCGINYGDLGGLPNVAGTIGYAKKAKYMDKCVSNSDCPLPDMACNEEQCKCEPGFPYDPSSETCVTSCTTYGDTFQTFWLAELTSTPRETDWNCGVHFNADPVECKSHCASHTWCKSFDHSAPLCTCKYHEETARTKPFNWHTFFTLYFHYQRNCA